MRLVFQFHKGLPFGWLGFTSGIPAPHMLHRGVCQGSVPVSIGPVGLWHRPLRPIGRPKASDSKTREWELH